MNIHDGRIREASEIAAMPKPERSEYREMRLDLTREQRRLMRVGRNDPCPCGSGKKFKKCCQIPR